MKSRVFLMLALTLMLSIFTNAQSVSIDFDLLNLEKIAPKLNGFNTGPALNEIFVSTEEKVDVVDDCSILPAPFNTIKDNKIVSLIPKDDFLEKTAELKPSMLRFPGGTIANYYHLYQYEDGIYDPSNPQFAPACGTLKIETQAYPTGNPIGKQFCQLDNRVDLEDPDENPNYINGFANLILDLEEKVNNSSDPEYKIDVIYVANLLTHFEFNHLFNTAKAEHLVPSDPEDILNIADPNSKFELYYKETEDAVQYLMDRGVNVVGVELSNEVYFGIYQNQQNNVTPQKYMQLGEIYAARLKNRFPEMKIGIATAADNNAWNSVVAAYEPAFYDGVVLHNYYNETTCINLGETCGSSCQEDVVNDMACRFDCGKCALGEYVNNDLLDIFESALEAFPEDKKIWMTEWGIISPNGQGNNLDYFNTLLYASFTLEHLLKQMEFNAKFGDRIEYSTHHRLGYKINWSVVQQNISSDEAVIRSNYFSFKFLKETFFSSDTYWYEGVAVEELEDDSDLFLRTLVTRDQDNGDLLVHLCYTNKSASEVPINLNGTEESLILDEYFRLKSEVIANYLKGSSLSSSFGITTFNNQQSDETNDPSLFVIEEESDTSSIFIPAFSTGVITFRLDNLVTTVDEISNQQPRIEVLPNPVRDVLLVRRGKNSMLNQIQIFDLAGKLLMFETFNGNKQSLDLSDLQDGIYLVAFIGESHTISKKIVKLSPQ